MILTQEIIKDCLNIYHSISFCSREQCRDVLEISNPTLSRYQNYINEVINDLRQDEQELIGWSYISNQRGFNRRCLFILAIFKALVNVLGIDQARLNLANELKEVFDGN